MKKVDGNWKEFEVYPNIKAKALITNNQVQQVKLLTKVPRGQYYSFLNDAGFEAEKMLPLWNTK